MLLGYTDAELANMGGYDLVHYDDLAYVASAHQECKYLLCSTRNYHSERMYLYSIIGILHFSSMLI